MFYTTIGPKTISLAIVQDQLQKSSYYQLPQTLQKNTLSPLIIKNGKSQVNINDPIHSKKKPLYQRSVIESNKKLIDRKTFSQVQLPPLSQSSITGSNLSLVGSKVFFQIKAPQNSPENKNMFLRNRRNGVLDVASIVNPDKTTENMPKMLTIIKSQLNSLNKPQGLKNPPAYMDYAGLCLSYIKEYELHKNTEQTSNECGVYALTSEQIFIKKFNHTLEGMELLKDAYDTLTKYLISNLSENISLTHQSIKKELLLTASKIKQELLLTASKIKQELSSVDQLLKEKLSSISQDKELSKKLLSFTQSFEQQIQDDKSKKLTTEIMPSRSQFNPNSPETIANLKVKITDAQKESVNLEKSLNESVTARKKVILEMKTSIQSKLKLISGEMSTIQKENLNFYLKKLEQFEQNFSKVALGRLSREALHQDTGKDHQEDYSKLVKEMAPYVVSLKVHNEQCNELVAQKSKCEANIIFLQKSLIHPTNKLHRKYG